MAGHRDRVAKACLTIGGVLSMSFSSADTETDVVAIAIMMSAPVAPLHLCTALVECILPSNVSQVPTQSERLWDSMNAGDLEQHRLSQ